MYNVLDNSKFYSVGLIVRHYSSFFLISFIALCMLGTVKIYIGSNLNWLILLAFISLSLLFSMPKNKSIKNFISQCIAVSSKNKLILIGWFLFLFGIFIAGILNHGVGLYTEVKYLALLFIMFLITAIPNRILNSNLLETSLKVSLIISIIPLIIMLVLREKEFLVILGDGRIGWLASWPGVIWKVGAFSWPFLVWACLKKPKFSNYFLTFLAVLTMALDGSRTSMIWIALVWLALGIVSVYAKLNSKGIIKGHLAVGIILVSCFTIIQPTLLGWVWGKYDTEISDIVTGKMFHNSDIKSTNIVSASPNLEIDMNKLFKNEGTPTVDRLVRGDNVTRMEMIEGGLIKVKSNFPWGGGFGSTRFSDNNIYSVLHMTYIQILADEGILSLIGFMMILVLPLIKSITFIIKNPSDFTSNFERMLTPLSVICLFLLMGLFHPLSNELTEWGIVLVSVALVMTNVKNYK